MVYHWQSHNVKLCGVDDMVLLPRPTEESIVDNLKKRFLDDYIYTCIGPVLISVNPFKQLPYFGEKEIELYQGAAPYENSPHIYGLSDQMFRNLLIDNESQCVIISGESGAGKTVAARYIMSYIARISGGSSKVQHVKDVVLNSNPLLEAFGNAKTIRNNNSSRFGKYVEIVFNVAGQPVGGRISNFLLEKSRVPNLTLGERNFHIFYQLCGGANAHLKKDLGIVNMNNFQYLYAGGSFSVDGVNDAKDFGETTAAMNVMGFSDSEQREIWNSVAAILHLGNINFTESGNYAQVSDKGALEWPAYLLGVDVSQLESKMTSRLFESKWGAKDDSINVTLNVEQAVYTRDALAKGIYSKIFDFLVQRVNAAMFTDSRGNNIGILDIYGFEILDKNGFEQLCINFVNEKLQQIFIQLTLKAEQEEYVAEKIAWTPIDYFNNQVVCELLEARQPPGLFLVLDDVCATLHAVADGADQGLHKKLNGSASSHKHYSPTAEGFVIQHYAGVVSYSVDGFCDRNRDVFFPDLVQLLQTSTSQLIYSLFPEPVARTRPTTAGTKIRSQAGELVAKLMQCAPHYVRCIKPNESKRAREWDDLRVKHQVEYLGLRENISVRRAGFAYRRVFKKFLHRYAILTKESWPSWRGREDEGVRHVLAASGLKEGHEFQLGKSKVFIKNPESIFHLEDLREQHFDKHARVIQKAFKSHFARKQQNTQRQEAAALFCGKKERRRLSVHRHFIGDYLGVSNHPELHSLVGRRERIFFSISVTKYDRRFKPSDRDLIITSRSLFLTSYEPGSGDHRNYPIIKRNIPFPNISHVSLSTLQDDFVVIHVKDDYDSLLTVPLKTEFLYALHKRYGAQVGRQLNIHFSNCVEFSVKKSGIGGGGKRCVVFVPTITGLDSPSLKISGTTLTVGIGAGLPPDTAVSPERNEPTRRRVNGKPGSAAPQKISNRTPTRAAPPPPGPRPTANRPTEPAPPPPPVAHATGPATSPPRVPYTTGPPSHPQPVPYATGPATPPPPVPYATGPANAPAPIPSVTKIQNGAIKEDLLGNNNFKLNKKTNEGQQSDLTKELHSTIGRFKSKDIINQQDLLEKNFNKPFSQDLTSTLKRIKAKETAKPIVSSENANDKLKVGGDLNADLTNTLRRIKAKGTVFNPPNSNLVPAATQLNNKVAEKPIPGGGRPRPTLNPSQIRVKAVYDYQSQDVDELTLKEGDLIDLIKEHPGGWWQGRLKGKEGLFPANYVLKL
ncbi:unconventional myosin-Ie-like isoform X2 [Thrips palmi]|uniref:Unconventional myosin-Ie-like isoform X2 n=1 Tax=Thrips palmi TaxID=161013 RepID=A0A6P8Z174_THRPL|nr:unconventional myosin-Ie-like isoform X2 [Thrips palmi]